MECRRKRCADATNAVLADEPARKEAASAAQVATEAKKCAEAEARAEAKAVEEVRLAAEAKAAEAFAVCLRSLPSQSAFAPFHGGRRGPVLCAPPTPPFPAPQSALSYNLSWRTLDLAKPLESLLTCS